MFEVIMKTSHNSDELKKKLKKSGTYEYMEVKLYTCIYDFITIMFVHNHLQLRTSYNDNPSQTYIKLSHSIS